MLDSLLYYALAARVNAHPFLSVYTAVPQHVHCERSVLLRCCTKDTIATIVQQKQALEESILLDKM